MNKKNKILLINPFWSYTTVYPPSNLAQLAAFLRKNDINVAITDLNFEIAKIQPRDWIQMSIDIINKEKPSVIGIICDTIHLPFCIEFIPRFKAANNKIPIILGGNHASADYKNLFDMLPIDFIVKGEGELTLLELIKNIDNPNKYKQIEGLIYKKKELQVNKNRPLINDLSILPLPAYDLLPNLNEYLKFLDSEIGISATRGCSYSCLFCSKENTGGNFRKRPIENIIEEIKYLQDKYGIKKISFDDNCLTTDKNWLLNLLEELIKLKIKFRCFARIDHIDNDILKKMVESGCYRIYHGIESGSKKLRKTLNKNYHEKFNNSKILEIIQKEKNSGLIVVCSFMTCIPGETEKDFNDTLNLAKDIKQIGVSVQLWIMTPYPGTAAYNLFKDKIIYLDRKQTLNQSDIFEDEQYLLFGDSIKKISKINPDNYIFKPNIELKKFFGLFHMAKNQLGLGSKKILLIKPPIEEVPIEIENYDSGFFTYASQPNALLRVGSYLESKGHKVSFLDCYAESIGKINSITNKEFIGYRIVGDGKTNMKAYHFGMSYPDIKNKLLNMGSFDEIWVSCTMTYHWIPSHRVIDICKEIFPKTKVLFGGIYPTLCPENARKSKADIIYQGEIKEANNFEADFDLLDYKPDYAILKSTRGCPNSCSYCAVHILEGNKMIFKSPEQTINEIFNINKKYGIKKFIFWESNFLINSKNHFERILDGVIERKLNLEFEAPEGFPPNLLSLDLAKKMREAGFKIIHLPLESSDKDMEKRFKRKSNLDDFNRAVHFLKEAGFDSKDIIVFVLAFLSDQKIESILNSFITVWELGCTPKIMPFTPIPGTEEYKKYEHIWNTRSLEELHPFLLPACGKNFSFSEAIELAQYNRMQDPINYLKLKKNINDIDKKFVKLIKNSNKMWDNYYKNNEVAWDTDLPDFTVVKAAKNFLNIKKDKTILDVGCGYGKNSAYLKSKGYDVYGIDISGYALDNLDKILNKKNFFLNDILSWKCYDKKFDVILDIGCFHMVNEDDIKKYIQKIHFLLKDNGKYILRCFSEIGYKVKRFHPRDDGLENKSPFLNYLRKEDLINMIDPFFKVVEFKELFFCPSKVDGVNRLAPGMYEIFSIKK